MVLTRSSRQHGINAGSPASVQALERLRNTPGDITFIPDGCLKTGHKEAVFDS